MNTNKNLSIIFDEITQKLKRENITVSNVKHIDYGIQFKIKLDNRSELMRIYQNKKGDVKFDYSQIKDPNFSQIIQNSIESNDTSGMPIEKGTSGIHLGFPIIGTDESGKGDYFGPLVAAGVYVDEKTAPQLQLIGVKDSKKINDTNIRIIAQKIRKICAGKYSIIEMSPEKYNTLYDQFRRENKNLNALLAWGHAKAIEEILQKTSCDKAISDQFADERYILGKLQEKGKNIDLVQMPKAEQNIAVAAASILARDRFVEKMAKLSNEYQLNLPKGASSAVIDAARKFVDLNGKDKLCKVAKLHFKTTERVIGKKG